MTGSSRALPDGPVEIHVTGGLGVEGFRDWLGVPEDEFQKLLPKVGRRGDGTWIVPLEALSGLWGVPAERIWECLMRPRA